MKKKPKRRGKYGYVEFLDMLNVYAPGRPLSEKVEAFLLSCGVLTSHIESIRRIIKNDSKKVGKI